MSVSSRLFESIVGALIIGIAAWFFVYAYSSRIGSRGPVYTLHARFDKADGLLVGSDVKVSGIKIGVVTHLTLDPQTYRAQVTFQLPQDIKMPTDSSAEVASEGFFGGKHLRLIPGGEETFLQPQETIEYTQSLPSLESLIGQFIFSSKKSEETQKDSLARTSSSSQPTP